MGWLNWVFPALFFTLSFCGLPASGDDEPPIPLFIPEDGLVLSSEDKGAVPLIEGLNQRAQKLVEGAPAAVRSELMVKMQMIFSELIWNVYKHAHREHPERKIFVRLSSQGERITFEVADEGGDFYDPYNAADRRNDFRFKTTEEGAELIDEMIDRRIAANHDPSRPHGDGGRGVLMVEEFTAGCHYEAHVREGKTVGTRVTAYWNFNDPPRFNCAKQTGIRAWLGRQWSRIFKK
jgi:hypothetical protein